MDSTVTPLGKTSSRRGPGAYGILECESAEYIFGNPGTTELTLVDALLQVPPPADVCCKG